MVEVAMIGGLLVGSLSTRDYFAKRSLKTLVSLAGVMLLLTGLSQLFSLPAIFSLLFLFITCFLSGKVNP
ncbi:transporter, partial [Streptococcus suis]